MSNQRRYHDDDTSVKLAIEKRMPNVNFNRRTRRVETTADNIMRREDILTLMDLNIREKMHVAEETLNSKLKTMEEKMVLQKNDGETREILKSLEVKILEEKTPFAKRGKARSSITRDERSIPRKEFARVQNNAVLRAITNTYEMSPKETKKTSVTDNITIIEDNLKSIEANAAAMLKVTEDIPNVRLKTKEDITMERLRSLEDRILRLEEKMQSTKRNEAGSTPKTNFTSSKNGALPSVVTKHCVMTPNVTETKKPIVTGTTGLFLGSTSKTSANTFASIPSSVISRKSPHFRRPAHDVRPLDRECPGKSLVDAAQENINGYMAEHRMLKRDVSGREGVVDLPLRRAVAHCDRSAVASLLATGADPNAKDSQGWTALHCAAVRDTDFSCGKLLLRAGARVDERTADGRTPLHLAAHWGRHGCVRQLLAAGADPAALDADGRRAEDVAWDVETRALLRAWIAPQ